MRLWQSNFGQKFDNRIRIWENRGGFLTGTDMSEFLQQSLADEIADTADSLARSAPPARNNIDAVKNFVRGTFPLFAAAVLAGCGESVTIAPDPDQITDTVVDDAGTQKLPDSGNNDGDIEDAGDNADAMNAGSAKGKLFISMVTPMGHEISAHPGDLKVEGGCFHFANSGEKSFGFEWNLEAFAGHNEQYLNPLAAYSDIYFGSNLNYPPLEDAPPFETYHPGEMVIYPYTDQFNHPRVNYLLEDTAIYKLNPGENITVCLVVQFASDAPEGFYMNVYGNDFHAGNGVYTYPADVEIDLATSPLNANYITVIPAENQP